MIGLDTNVVVRYVMQDDDVQTALADQIFDELTADHQGFLSLLTLVELFWVLRRAYGRNRADAARVLTGLVDSVEIRVQDPSLVRVALREVDDGTDFADALIAGLGRRAGCTETVTFDRAAAARGAMRLLS